MTVRPLRSRQVPFDVTLIAIAYSDADGFGVESVRGDVNQYDFGLVIGWISVGVLVRL